MQCQADEAGWQQLPEQDGVENQPFHPTGPGSQELGQACIQPGHGMGMFLLSPSQPLCVHMEPPPWLAGTPGPSAQRPWAAMGGSRQELRGNTWNSLDSQGLILPGAAGVLDIFGYPRARAAGSCRETHLDLLGFTLANPARSCRGVGYPWMPMG